MITRSFFSPIILLSAVLLLVLIVCLVSYFDSSSKQQLLDSRSDTNKKVPYDHLRKLERRPDFLKKNDRSFKINSANNAHFGGNPTVAASTKDPHHFEAIRAFQYKDLKNPVPEPQHLGPFFEVVSEETIRSWYDIDLFSSSDEVAQKKGKVYYSIFCK
jgi:hypothetical protein